MKNYWKGNHGEKVRAKKGQSGLFVQRIQCLCRRPGRPARRGNFESCAPQTGVSTASCTGKASTELAPVGSVASSAARPRGVLLPPSARLRGACKEDSSPLDLENALGGSPLGGAYAPGVRRRRRTGFSGGIRDPCHGEGAP